MAVKLVRKMAVEKQIVCGGMCFSQVIRIPRVAMKRPCIIVTKLMCQGEDVLITGAKVAIRMIEIIDKIVSSIYDMGGYYAVMAENQFFETESIPPPIFANISSSSVSILILQGFTDVINGTCPAITARFPSSWCCVTGALYSQ